MADDDPKKPFDAVFYLKGGAWFSVRLDELSTQRSQLSGELTRVSWTSADLAGLEVAPADLMKVADWLLALPVPVTDVVDARARFVREMVQAGVVRLKRTGPEVACD